MSPEIRQLQDEQDDMHYHCECCGSTSAEPAVCTTSKCEARGEQMVLCRKSECAPAE